MNWIVVLSIICYFNREIKYLYFPLIEKYLKL